MSPAGASSGVNITIRGTGFDSTAGNNRVTFTPGGTTAVTVAPLSVSAADATGTRTLTVAVPPDLPVGPAALRITNTVTGEIAEGRAVDVLTLSLPEVSAAAPGATGVRVRVTGSPNVNFVAAGGTRVVFSGTGITVTSTTIESPTSLIATINVASTAATTLRDVSTITSTQTGRLRGGFTVGTPTPTLTANIQVAGFSGVYDGSPHGATGTATGVNGESLGNLLHFNQTHTNVPGGSVHWTFDGNSTYKPASGDAQVVITPANALVDVSGFNGLFDGNPHGATGTATGVLGENLSALLHLGSTFTDPPGGITHWTFEGNTNYKSSSGDVAITITRPNRSPSFTSTPVTTAKHQFAYSYQATATDPDGDALSFALTISPSGMTIDANTGAIAWTPTGNQIGPQPITVVVRDTQNASDTQSFAITVADVTPPVVNLELPTEVLPGATVDALADATDNVGVTTVTFEVNGRDPIDRPSTPYTRAIAVPHDAVAGTEYHVRATAKDAAGNSGTADRSFRVAAVADTQPPTIVLNAPPRAAAGATIRVTAAAADNVGVKTITFKADNSPLVSDPEHRDEAMYTIPQTAVVGSTIQFTARATDFSGNLADAAAATLVVAGRDTTPPQVQLTAPATVPEGGTLGLSATATDDVSVAGVEFFVNGVSVGTANVEPYTATFKLPIAVVAGDLLNAEARAFDAEGNQASSTGQTSVLAAPNRPPIANAGGPYTGEAGDLVALTAAASTDPDPGDQLTFDWDFGDSSTGSGMNPTHAYAAVGVYTATLTVADGRGGSSTATAPVTVTAATDDNPPNVALFGPATALPGTQVTMTARATDDRGVVAVAFAVNGGSQGETSTEPYQHVVTIPSVAAPGDQVAVRATARDLAGNTASADAAITITAQPDTEPPTVAINAPPQAAAGSTVRLSASVHDNVGVQSVTISVNGGEPTVFAAPPYEVSYTVPPEASAGSVVGVLATGTDFTGNKGEAVAGVSVVATGQGDTTPPTVKLTAPLQVFAGKKLSLSAEPHDDVGVASVAFLVDGVNVATLTAPPYTVDVDLAPSHTPGTLLKLRAIATDFANLQGTDNGQTLVVSTASAGQGVLTGELYNDYTSLPIAGAAVTLSGTDNTGAAYNQITTTDARGRWVLRGTEGQGIVRITKPGFTSVDRPTSILVNQAVELFDGRATPMAASPTNVSAVLGGVVTGGGAMLQLQAGALATATDLRLTNVSQQGLQGVLPPGWSPIAAADITPHGMTFSVAGTLSLPNTFRIAPGRTFVAAKWDEVVGRWRAVGQQTVPASTNASLETSVSTTGQFALLLADTLPSAPPLPAPGEPIEGVALSPLANSAVTTVDPQPRILFYAPGVRSDVHGSIVTGTPATSGLPIETRLTETYRFLNTGALQPELFVEDLFFYQVGGPANGLGATFPVMPSETFEPLSLQLGVISVELLAPPVGTRTVTSIAANGGSAVASSGETLQVPQGALAASLPISVRGLGTNNLGVTLPTGFELAGAALFSFSGSFTKSAVLSVAKPAGISDANQLLLVRPEALDGQTRLVLVGRARIVGNQIISDTTLAGVPDVFEGVRGPGRYLFVRSTTPFGFVKGIVSAPGGGAFGGAMVSADTFPIVALSGGAGAYVAAAAVGPLTLTARDLQKSDFGTATSAVANAGSIVALNVQIATALPTITSVAPADGETNVSLSSPVIVRFSRSIDPASVNGANAVNSTLTSPGGSIVEALVSLSDKNTVLTLRPTTALEPNTMYAVNLGTGITDQAGRHLASPFVSRFTSFNTAPPPPPPAGSITATIPDEAGYVTITATQGTAGVHDTVTIVNLTKKSTMPVLVEPDGSFSVVAAAKAGDQLRIAITSPGGTQTVIPISRLSQTNADGSVSAVIGSEGGHIDGPAGIAVDVPFHAFPDGTVVSIKQLSETDLPAFTAEQRASFPFAGAFSLDFGGVTPQRYINVSIQPAANDKPGDQWIVSQVIAGNSRNALNVVDTAKLIDGRIMTSSPPCPGVTGQGVFGIHKANQRVGVAFSLADAGLEMDSESPLAGYVEELGLSPFVNYLVSLLNICMPIGTGRATVTENVQTLTVSGTDLPLVYREIVVTNPLLSEEFHFARNVIEPSFVVSGRESDKWEVVVDQTTGQLFTFFRIEPAGGGKLRITLDPDHLTIPVTNVVITDATTNQVFPFTPTLTDFTVRVPGGSATTSSYKVEAIPANGPPKIVPATVLPPDPALGPGTLVLRVTEGTIDPTQTEIDGYNNDPARVGPKIEGAAVNSLTLLSSTKPDLPIDLNRLHRGALSVAFDDKPTSKFTLTIGYTDGKTAKIDIPRFRVTVRNAQTGHIIRTISGPAPPPGEPLNLRRLTNADTPPVIISGPSRFSNFDPAASIAFRFSAEMDPGTLTKGFIVEHKTSSGSWVAVDGRVTLSEDNSVATFSPTTGLGLGEEYRIRFENVTSKSGKNLLWRPLTLTTFKPKRICPAGMSSCTATYTPQTAAGLTIPLRDLAIVRRSAGGGQTTTNVVALTDTNSGFLAPRLFTFDVTNPENVLKLGEGFGGAGKRRLTIVPNAHFTYWKTLTGTCTPTASSFTGDLAVTTSNNLDFSFLTVFDITHLDKPCDIGSKILTANPETLNDSTRFGTFHVSGSAQGVAVLNGTNGPIAYAAVRNFGLMNVELAQNTPSRPPAPQTNPDRRFTEGTYGGDYYDVVAIEDRLIAIERTEKRLDVLDSNFALLTSLDLSNTPRRLIVANDWPIDFNNDGTIDPEEMRRVAFVGEESAIQFVDLTDLSAPKLLGDVPMPPTLTPANPTPIVRELDADPGRRQIFAGGTRQSGGDALYVIDGSNLLLTGLIDNDQDIKHWDDRILWSMDYPKGIGGIKADGERGLVHVAQPDGLDSIAIRDRCCDLVIDLTSQRVENPSGDRGQLYSDEREALRSGIEHGLDTAIAQCGTTFGTAFENALANGRIWILEQGSGACTWDPKDPAACSQNPTYQPGVSDHDYEVFFPESLLSVLDTHVPPSVQCVTDALTNVFVDGQKRARPIEVPNGGGKTISFNDITFYPLNGEAFASGKLPIIPLIGSGSDGTGDMGLGRQQLLFGKFLLEGQYVSLSKYDVTGPDLEGILVNLRKPENGIPRLEGFEWALLQDYALAKTKAYIRVNGGSDPTSSLHEFYIRQIHDAGKAAIRAAMARMVADQDSNKAVLDVTKVEFNGGACLEVSSVNPNEWEPRKCGGFEDYVASMAAKRYKRAQDTAMSTFFSLDDVILIQRFYRIKADREQIPTEAEADRFILAAAQFISRVRQETEPIYNLLLLNDSAAAQRTANRTKALSELSSKLTKSVLHVTPRVSNVGFHDAGQVSVKMFRIDNPAAPPTGSPAKEVPPPAFMLPASSERFLDYDANLARDPDDEVTANEENAFDSKRLEKSDRKALFSLGESGNPKNPVIDQTTGFGSSRAIVFSIDLPERTVREANRRNNVTGFYYYILDRTAEPSTWTPPAVPGPLPTPFSDPKVFDPNPECADPPSFTVVPTYSFGQLHLTIKNVSSGVLKDISYCSNIAASCVGSAAASLAPGDEVTIDIPVTPPPVPTLLDIQTTIFASDSDGNAVQLATGRQLSIPASTIAVRLFDASPLTSFTHPFSRYAISHKVGSAELRPITGAVTDGTDASVKISIDGLQPGAAADLSLADSKTFTITDGVGWLTPAAAVPGTPAPRLLKLTVTADANGHAEAYYTPPEYFLRPTQQKADFDLVERAAALTVQQNSTGTSVVHIRLRRPPVFLVHGLFGSIGVWDKFRPLVPETEAQYFKSRAGWVGPNGGRFDLFNVGFNVATEHLSEEVKTLRLHIALSLREYLAGFAISKVDLVAHSMGGLMSRKMIGEDAEIRSAVRKLIIINSPLRGSPLADKAVETRDLVQNLLANTPQDPWALAPSPEVQEAVQGNFCYNAFQLIGQLGDFYFGFHILDGALDDLQTTSPQIPLLKQYVAAGLTVPTHHFVTTTTGNDLGYSLEVSGLWILLGLACNWTPDTTTTSTTQLLKVGAEAALDLVSLGVRGVAGLGAKGVLEALKTGYDAFKLETDQPFPVFGSAASDHIVPVTSQLEDLLPGDPSVTEVFGNTDHQDIKSTNVLVEKCVDIDANGVKQFHTPAIVPDLDGDGQPDAVCHLIKLLELDPKKPQFKP